MRDVILNTSLASIDARVAANTTTIASNSVAISANTTAIALRALDSAAVHLTGNETVAGVKTFTSAPLINTNSIATTADVSAVNSAPSTLDTLGEISTVLQNNKASVSTILSSMVTLSGNQTVAGVKTFSATPVITGG